MLKITLNEAQSQLPELLKAAAEGQEIIIQNNEGQDFQLISISPSRLLGLCYAMDGGYKG